MSRSRLELLQWFGLLAGPLAWAMQLVLGSGLTLARCGEGGRGWAIANHAWQLALTTVAASVAVAAVLAAARVYRELRTVPDDATAPLGRLRFLAVGALAASVLFFVAIVLSGIGVVSQPDCRAG
jgi:hypothetical protein